LPPLPSFSPSLPPDRRTSLPSDGRSKRWCGNGSTTPPVYNVLVDGERLEGVGVKPDVLVADDLTYAEGRDPQFERALEVAAGRGPGLRP
jgi:hypothetical protein